MLKVDFAIALDGNSPYFVDLNSGYCKLATVNFVCSS